MFIRAESQDLTPQFHKVVDTPVFKIVVQCGHEGNKERFTSGVLSEKLIFRQEPGGNDIIYSFNTIFANHGELLSPTNQNSLMQYFVTD